MNQREDRTLPELVRLAENLSDGTLSLGDLGRVMRGETVSPRKEPEPPQHTGAGTLYLVAMNAPVRAEVKVTKDEFVIGKNPAAVDAALTFSRMISRVHCKISRRRQRVYGHGSEQLERDVCQSAAPCSAEPLSCEERRRESGSHRQIFR